MPTDLPPDYKPKPAADPDAKDPTAAPAPDQDSVDGARGVPRPGPGVGVGRPGTDGDVVDPSGFPKDDPLGIPSPAGMPTF